MWGDDIIVYGNDLADYIDRDFGPFDEESDWEPAPQVPIPFWENFLL
ncbi:hypothetical protein CLV63_1319 [Murinocardiopsis flavida]|uniref:Uncharacterized protein n=1 Tax=Murinocardiopsis flavida TaxID=645275 RepID=A0A2P8CR75_9ACTN|nr:hypothetical protein [Murinocardiopsis flavida]PSK87456.1 hypothetical protein CLV63_1319 [Murinocardiopsis flavida]